MQQQQVISGDSLKTSFCLLGSFILAAQKRLSYLLPDDDDDDHDHDDDDDHHHHHHDAVAAAATALFVTAINHIAAAATVAAAAAAFSCCCCCCSRILSAKFGFARKRDSPLEVSSSVSLSVSLCLFCLTVGIAGCRFAAARLL